MLPHQQRHAEEATTEQTRQERGRTNHLMQWVINGEYADERHRDPGDATNQQQQRPPPAAQ